LLRWRLLHLLLELFDARFDPRVAEGVLGRHALIRFPLKALIDEVHEVALIFICLHQLRQLLRINLPHLSFRVWLLQRPVVVVEEDLSARSDHNHGAWRHSLHLHNALHLLFLILACKNRVPDEQLVKDAAKGPHVDRRIVADAHHDLWRSIEPRLDISVELVLLVRARAKVNDFDTTLVTLAKQNILGLHITVHNAELFHVME